MPTMASTYGAAGRVVVGAAVFELPGAARTPARLDLLLNLVTSSSDASQADEVLRLIAQSGLLAQVPHDETQHKLTVRINALISSQNALGYRLAHAWIQQDPAVWNEHLIANAATWTTQILNLIGAPEKLLHQRANSDRLLAAALQFATTHIFPENIAARQEFYRQVVHPNLPKLVVGLAQLLDFILKRVSDDGQIAHASQLHVVLVFINRLMHAHPAQFRPVSARIHECISSLLYADDAQSLAVPIFTAAAEVLASLHLTGALSAKGSEASGGNARTTQAQLWQATIENQLHLATEAWRFATSSYQATEAAQQGESNAGAARPQSLKAYPKDPLAATRVAHECLALLLGTRGRPGLISLHLRAATARPVPVPAGKIVSLCLDMLHVDVSSRFKPTAEAKLCTLQASHLAALHTRALALVSQLALVAPAAIPLEAARLLGDVCRLAEGGGGAQASARVRLAAMRTLVVLVGRQGIALPLDPAGRTTLRLARLAVTQIARAVLQPAGASGDAARSAKKARLYESDSLFTSGSAKDRMHSLAPEEVACTIAALHILVAVYPLLTTSLSSVHYDLMQLAVHNVQAMVEVLSDSIGTHSSSLRAASAGAGIPSTAELFEEAVGALGDMCLDSTSSVLAMVLPRAIAVLGRVANAPSGCSGRVRVAAQRALVAVHASRKGKFVPVARGVGFGPRAADDLDAIPDGAKLAGATALGRSIPAAESVESSLEEASTAVLGKRQVEQEEEEVVVGDRMDVDAIAAESNELFQAGGADASTSVAGGALGLGRPGSPLRSPVEKRIFSPDPVKPIHRTSTPRIGSPSTSHPRALSRPASPTPDQPAPSMLTPGRMVSPTAIASTTTLVAEEPTVGAVQEAQPAETAKPTVQIGAASEDDDDDEMPEIDMSDSDSDEQ
ncbi:hypothetical protein PaG_01870 [Moesziomyces aphidis]|uniref:Pre-rRNA-processing protein RIX1 N-terminal domain-containing protein n=1 Tax=Moesziomyces aphidis TaxID=84754 RepID=W3VRZ1_MOEAP|nr:hypothetical protein PaG_01870 [Moesziomyces aphidis]